MTQLRIVLDSVLGALHRQGANPRCLAALGELVFAKRLAPRLDVFVELLLVFEASADRGEFRRPGPGRRAHHLYQLLPLLVRMTDDDAPVVIAAGIGAIGVVRRHSRAAVVA